MNLLMGTGQSDRFKHLCIASFLYSWTIRHITFSHRFRPIICWKHKRKSKRSRRARSLLTVGVCARCAPVSCMTLLQDAGRTTPGTRPRNLDSVLQRDLQVALQVARLRSGNRAVRTVLSGFALLPSDGKAYLRDLLRSDHQCRANETPCGRCVRLRQGCPWDTLPVCRWNHKPGHL